MLTKYTRAQVTLSEMNTEQGFTLHPGAAQDITDIWELILEDNPLAARRVREDILDAVRKLVPFPHQGHKRPDFTTKPLRLQLSNASWTSTRAVTGNVRLAVIKSCNGRFPKWRFNAVSASGTIAFLVFFIREYLSMLKTNNTLRSDHCRIPSKYNVDTSDA